MHAHIPLHAHTAPVHAPPRACTPPCMHPPCMHTSPSMHTQPLCMHRPDAVLNACYRGCRLFSICHFVDASAELNATRAECEAACAEAYGRAEEQFGCATGCRKQLPQAESGREQVMPGRDSGALALRAGGWHVRPGVGVGGGVGGSPFPSSLFGSSARYKARWRRHPGRGATCPSCARAQRRRFG
uniref:Uncharacterized protein n=1 Tax=Apteryx owenii TaxID=8824 RepID=A0A8B9P897_APTOW